MNILTDHGHDAFPVQELAELKISTPEFTTTGIACAHCTVLARTCGCLGEDEQIRHASVEHIRYCAVQSFLAENDQQRWAAIVADQAAAHQEHTFREDPAYRIENPYS